MKRASAAPRDRSDPRAGSVSSIIRRSQQEMMTLVNGKVVLGDVGIAR
jgi:hypothetical protein